MSDDSGWKTVTGVNDTEKSNKVVDFFVNPELVETPMQVLKEIENEVMKGFVDDIMIVVRRKNEDGGCALRWASSKTDWENKAAMASYLFSMVNR